MTRCYIGLLVHCTLFGGRGCVLISTLGEGRCGRLYTGMMSIIVMVLALCVDTRLCRSLQSHFNDSFIHLMSRVISRLPSLLYYVCATLCAKIFTGIP